MLGGVFIVAGALKVIDPQSSVAAVRAYRLLPSSLETMVGWGLPFAEIALGLLLLAGIATRAVAAATAILLLVFIVAVASAAVRGLSIDCGCFGGGGEVAPGQTAYGAELRSRRWSVAAGVVAGVATAQPARARWVWNARDQPHDERRSRESGAMNQA